MGLLDQLGGMLQQYTNVQPHQAPASVLDDYEQVARNASQSTMAGGIAEAIRSQHTPPFGNVVSSMFSQADPSQRAGVLNELLGVVGPGVLGGLLGNLGGGLANQLGHQQITPEMAQQIPPEAVQQMAQQAEQQDPSVIDRVSQVYAEHPMLFKMLGSAAAAVALNKIAQSEHVGPY